MRVPSPRKANLKLDQMIIQLGRSWPKIETRVPANGALVPLQGGLVQVNGRVEGHQHGHPEGGQASVEGRVEDQHLDPSHAGAPQKGSIVRVVEEASPRLFWLGFILILVGHLKIGCERMVFGLDAHGGNDDEMAKARCPLER